MSLKEGRLRGTGGLKKGIGRRMENKKWSVGHGGLKICKAYYCLDMVGGVSEPKLGGLFLSLNFVGKPTFHHPAAVFCNSEPFLEPLSLLVPCHQSFH